MWFAAGLFFGALFAHLEMKRPRRRMMTEDDFARLVRGGIVDLRGVQVALKDIGWDRMYFQLERAMRDAGVDEL